LKVNYAGVMPVIFAQALLVFLRAIAQMASRTSPTAQGWLRCSTRDGSITSFRRMIFFFSYFWVPHNSMPQQIAEDLKKYGGYVTGVRPGKRPRFLDSRRTRLTFAGRDLVILTIIAILPQMLSQHWACHIYGAVFRPRAS